MTAMTGRTGTETRHGRRDQADLWADEAEMLNFSHAAGPGTWGVTPASPDPLRPGLIMFDRNPRSAVDSGGTRCVTLRGRFALLCLVASRRRCRRGPCVCDDQAA